MIKAVKKLIVFLSFFTVVTTMTNAYASQGVSSFQKLADSFMYLVDNSGSMMMKSSVTDMQKIEMAKQIMLKLDSYIPDLNYQGAIGLFSPNKTVLQPTPWAKFAFTDAILSISNSAPIFGRLTDMSDAVPEINELISSLPGQTAVFLISDGKENYGTPPVEAISALYAANPNILIHVISVADTVQGANNLMEIVELNPGSIYINGNALLASDTMANEVITNSLYTSNSNASTPHVTSLSAVLFADAQTTIDPIYDGKLREIAQILATRPDLMVLVEGFASPTGTLAQNEILAQNRATVVANRLIADGVNPKNIIVKGSGVLDKYAEYKDDRRVDIMIIWK